MNNKLITIQDAMKIMQRKEGAVYRAIKEHYLDGFDVNGTTMLLKEQVQEYTKKRDNNELEKLIRSPFDDISLYWNESLKLVDFFHNSNALGFGYRFLNSKYRKYAISNLGRFFNISDSRELTPSIATHGYQQVAINGLEIRLHRLVALFWCPNRFLKPEVHHIRILSESNDRASNLVWVTKQQHLKADRMRRKAEQTDEWDAYLNYIDELRQENEWDRDYMCIPFEKDNGIVFAYVTAQAYNDYKHGKRTLDEIYYYDILTDVFVSNEKINERKD